jgi:hypothetical protein
MLHDDIYSIIKNNHHRVIGDSMQLQHIELILRKKPVGIYFDNTVKENSQLYETAKEFFYNGFLTFPFDDLIFHVKDFFVDESDTGTKDLTIWVTKEDNIYVCSYVYKRTKDFGHVRIRA